MQTIGIKIKGREGTADIRLEKDHALVIDIHETDGGFESRSINTDEVGADDLWWAADELHRMLEGQAPTDSEINDLVRIFEQFPW